ncbi:protein kinase domain protein, partial [Ichthyophthirius multifiliis]
MTLKLGDFGLATKLENDQEKKTTICGTPNYIAPEILEGKEGHSYEVDIWSLGVIIYTLLIGKPPFETKDVKTTYKKIRQNNYCFPEHIQISENAKSLIQIILNLNPLKRPSMYEILQHPFMVDVDKFPQTLPVYTLSVPYKERIGNKHSYSQNNLKANLLENGKINTDNNNNNFGNMRTQSIKSIPNNKNLNKQYSQQQNNNNQNQNQNLKNTNIAIQAASDIWVKQWVDYSNKYGLGYLLSNGSCGVFYNDCSKIIMDQSALFLEYYEKVQNQKQDKLTVYNINNYPQELNKKVTLLQHFRSYLESQNSDQGDGLM